MRTFSLFFVYFCLLKNITSWRHSVTKASPTGEMRQSAVQSSDNQDMGEKGLEQLKDTFSTFFSEIKPTNEVFFKKYGQEWNKFLGLLNKLNDAVKAKNEKRILEEAGTLIADEPNAKIQALNLVKMIEEAVEFAKEMKTLAENEKKGEATGMDEKIRMDFTVAVQRYKEIHRTSEEFFKKYGQEWNKFLGLLNKLKDAVEAKDKKSILEQAKALIADEPNAKIKALNLVKMIEEAVEVAKKMKEIMIEKEELQNKVEIAILANRIKNNLIVDRPIK
eukprot:GHVL01019944.1.p1 GENE.GHVL01019944.1~~GHVL01019944.1.p1  ORF type:complete len:277 (-),score=60.62 GHVL01019944.1:92-922(-)